MGAESLMIIGGQWGDEGKGKVVDLLSSGFSTVVRYNGGKKGTDRVHDTNDPLPVIDSLLAATAMVHGLTLVTRNVDDVKRTGVPCLNPFEALPR